MNDHGTVVAPFAHDLEEDAGVPAHDAVIFEDTDDEILIRKLLLEHPLNHVEPQVLPRFHVLVVDEGVVDDKVVAQISLDSKVIEQLQRVALLNFAISNLLLALLLPEHRQSVHLLSPGEDGAAEDLVYGERHAVIHHEGHLQTRREEEVILVLFDLAGVPSSIIDALVERTRQMTLTLINTLIVFDLLLQIDVTRALASTGATLRASVLYLGGVLLGGVLLGGFIPGGLLLGRLLCTSLNSMSRRRVCLHLLILQRLTGLFDCQRSYRMN